MLDNDYILLFYLLYNICDITQQFITHWNKMNLKVKKKKYNRMHFWVSESCCNTQIQQQGENTNKDSSDSNEFVNY